MIGVFVQLNEASHFGRWRPIGYVIQENGCWEWVGTRLRAGGYGRWFFRGKQTLAHRASYVLHKGPIPDGLTLDHLCRNRGCINPDHLEPVTMKENNARGFGVGALASKKTHCLRGHPLYGPNLYVYPDGRRGCRRCKREQPQRHG